MAALLDFPLEIVQQIVHELPMPDVQSLMRSCRALHIAALPASIRLIVAVVGRDTANS